ncbi:MAG: PaaI family thioesterase [Bacteroidia bacterium]|nr:PaaI family thioesterase [Bacteroidia bacterium]
MNTNKTDLIERYIAHNHFGKLIGMDFEIISEGSVDYSLIIKEEHLATPNAAHGGVISALIDGALGVAGLSSVYKENKVVSTIEYKLNFLSPALLGDQLIAKAKVEQKGKRILIISCDVFCANRENKLLAKSLGTFNAYDAAKAGYN